MAAGDLQNVTYEYADDSSVTFWPDGPGCWRVTVYLTSVLRFQWDGSPRYKPSQTRAATFRRHAIKQAAEAGKKTE